MANSGSVGRERNARPIVLHVSADFPDPIEPSKTKAIRNLVELTADRFEHHVISINRVSPTRLEMVREIVSPHPLAVEAASFEHGIALTYRAPGRGIRHQTKLHQLGDWIADYIASMPRTPDLIVGHKFAIEGLAVRQASRKTGIPYGLSIQGDSDTKVMDARRDLTGELRKVLHESRITFPFAPWAWQRVTDRLDEPPAQHIMLPCATELDQPMAPNPEGKGLLSVFHLMSHRRKNLAGMRQAVRLLADEGSVPALTIVGGGDADLREHCEAMVADTEQITLAGAKDRGAVRTAMNGSIAFVLPSLRESFGLVFIEALFAGLPIIYPRGTSVDGYFDDAPFALPVDARDPRSIARAIETAVSRERELKSALAEWQHSDDARRFQRDRIADQFAAGLDHAIGR